MGLARRLLLNTAVSGLASSASAVISFLLLPFLVGILGAEQYGLVGFAQVFSMSAGIGSVTDLGLRQAIAKYVAEFHAQNESAELRATVLASLLLLGAVGVLMATIGLAFAGKLTSLLTVPGAYHASFRIALTVVFLSYVIELPNVVFEGVLEGFQEYPFLKGVQATYAVLYAVSAAAAVALGYSFVAVIVAAAGVRVLTTTANAVRAVRRCGPWSSGTVSPSMPALRRLLRMSMHLFSAQISGAAGWQVERLLIALMLTPTFMTLYEVLVKLPRFLKSSLSFLGAAVMPAASELAAKNDSERSARLFQEGLRLSLIISSSVTFAAMVAADNFLAMWMGAEFAYLAVIMRVLLVVNILSPIANFGWRILIGSDTDVNVIPILQWVNTLVKVAVLSIFLDRIGLWAVAVASLSLVLTLPISFGIFTRRLGLSVWTEVYAILLILGLSLASPVVMISWAAVHPFGSLLELIAAAAVASGVSISLVAASGVSPFLLKTAKTMMA